MNKPRVCIINIYFGPLPEWVNMWFSSASWNKNIDFLFVTDQEVDFKVNNIKIIKMTYDDFKKLAAKKLGQKIKLDDPHKLCDYKMVWPKIFDDETKEYDFCGECDVDVIFGDLDKFLQEYELDKYDKFGSRGHLTIYRNNEEVMNRYKLNGGWFGTYKEIFKSNYLWAFDETPGMNAIYEKHGFPAMNKKIFADIDVNYKDLRLVEFEDATYSNYPCQLFYWNKGKVLRDYIDNGKVKTDEFMYIHLQKREMFKADFDPFTCANYLITNGRFIENNSCDTIEKKISLYNKREEAIRLPKRFGGKYKKNLKFYWIGRRVINIWFDSKRVLKRIIKKVKGV